jgi:hypothetical protein
VAADLEAVVSAAADLAVFGAVDLEWECPAGLEAGSPAAGSGAWAGGVDIGPEEAGDGGAAAGDGAFLLRLASVAGAGAGAGAIRTVAGAVAIRMAMVVVAGAVTGTGGTAVTSPMVGIDTAMRAGG